MESTQHSDVFEVNALSDFASRLLALTDTLESLYDVNLKTGAFSYFIKPKNAREKVRSNVFENKDFFADLRLNMSGLIFEDDLDEVCTVLTRSFLTEELSKRNHFDWYFRLMLNNKPAWYMLRVVYRDESKERVIIGVINAEKDMQLRNQATFEALLKHETFQTDLLNYYTENEGNPIHLLKHFLARLLDLYQCDQVVYRDLKEAKISLLSSNLNATWNVPISHCLQCELYDASHSICMAGLKNSVEDQEKDYNSLRFPKCPVKSSLTRTVMQDGKPAGYLSVNYIEEAHDFEKYEYKTLEDICRILSIVLSRTEARKANNILRKEIELKNQVEQSLQIIEGLASTYSIVFLIDILQNKVIPYAANDSAGHTFKEGITAITSYTDVYKSYVDKLVFAPDVEEMVKVCSIANLKKQLRNKKTFSHIYRSSFSGKIEYREITFVKCDDENSKPTSVVVGISDKHSDLLEHKVIETLSSDYTSIYIADLDNNYCQPILHSKEYDKIVGGKQRSFSKVNTIFSELVDEKYKEFWTNFSDPSWTKHYLSDSDRKEYLYHITRHNHWYRSEFRVMERNSEGEASKIITTVQIVDAEYAEKMAADQKLEKALEDAKAASRAKSTFLSNMSHDIRTPMNAIIGFTNLAVSHIDDLDLVRSYLTKISQSSSHLLSLINDVLDMSRIESGKMSLTESEENLAEIIHMVRSIIEYDIRSKDLDFQVEVVDLFDEDIVVDKLRLNQVLLNTLNNAIKYTPRGGSVSLTISEQSCKKKGYATYEFKVKDSGVGMSADFARTIFDPFTREKTSTISGIQGTGLGMSITKSIVDLMGGTIGVSSEEGHGTEVTVCCTFKLVKQQPRPKHKDNRSKSSKIKKILMVEDNPLNREIATELLEESGFTIDTVNDGAYAVETMKNAKAEDYDLILMDIQMPIMDGYQATREIRALHNGTEKIPIIAITANAFDEDRHAALEAGMNDHVSKPINLQQLLDAIARLN